MNISGFRFLAKKHIIMYGSLYHGRGWGKCKMKWEKGQGGDEKSRGLGAPAGGV
jgi:hypothetical protein